MGWTPVWFRQRVAAVGQLLRRAVRAIVDYAIGVRDAVISGIQYSAVFVVMMIAIGLLPIAVGGALLITSVAVTGAIPVVLYEMVVNDGLITGSVAEVDSLPGS